MRDREFCLGTPTHNSIKKMMSVLSKARVEDENKNTRPTFNRSSSLCVCFAFERLHYPSLIYCPVSGLCLLGSAFLALSPQLSCPTVVV